MRLGLGLGMSAPVINLSDPFYSSLVLLVPFEGADESTTYTDFSATPDVLTGGGGAKIDTARHVDGALLLNGTSSGSRVTTTANCGVGTGAFTMEAYVRPTAAQTGRIFSAQSSGSPNAVAALRTDSAGSITALLRDSSGAGLMVMTSTTGIVAMNDTQEYHIAWTRDGSGNNTIWLDGASVATASSSTNPNATRLYFIGALDDTQERFAGTIRWARVSEGVCRYTSTFTPPSIPFPLS